jgi:hypothetical protein
MSSICTVPPSGRRRVSERTTVSVSRATTRGRGTSGALAALDGEEGLGQRDGDLVGIEGDDRAVAADDLQGGERRFRCRRTG